jgi:hypothetical protein
LCEAFVVFVTGIIPLAFLVLSATLTGTCCLCVYPIY